MSRKQKQEEQPDALGFTSSDYEEQQRLIDLRGEKATPDNNGWDVTKEQIDIINCTSHPLHGVAVYCFYDMNFIRLQRMAKSRLRKYGEKFKHIADYEDLLQQLFCDLLCGDLKLPHDTAKIRNAVYKSFIYAPVGGLEGVAI